MGAWYLELPQEPVRGLSPRRMAIAGIGASFLTLVAEDVRLPRQGADGRREVFDDMWWRPWPPAPVVQP